MKERIARTKKNRIGLAKEFPPNSVVEMKDWYKSISCDVKVTTDFGYGNGFLGFKTSKMQDNPKDPKIIYDKISLLIEELEIARREIKHQYMDQKNNV
jgi:hypothetical protein